MNTAEELHRAGGQRLVGLVEVRKAALSDYLTSIRQDLTTQASNLFVHAALGAFKVAWNDFGGSVEAELQKHYISGNPHPTGEKHKLDAASDGSRYSDVHGRYHPWFRAFLEERGYYDIFLFDAEGDLVYTVFKELEYATNLSTGKWKDTDLGNAFRAAKASAGTGAMTFFDFKPYAPSHGAAAAFISTAISGVSGRFEGALVFQMPIDRMNAVMANAAGLGETGKTYLVGEDLLMRSDSRFSKETTILKMKVDSSSVAKAFAGETGAHEIRDYRGVEVLSAYGAIAFLGTTWALIAEIDAAEALAGLASVRDRAVAFGLVILLLVLGAAIVLSRGLTRLIARMTEAMQALADGDFDREIPASERGDELGRIAETLHVFKTNGIEACEANLARVEEQAAKECRAAMIEAMIADFDAEASEILNAVAASAGDLKDTSNGMSDMANSTNQQVATVGAAAEEASANVQTMASSAEELSSSVVEISSQISHANEIALQASNEANQSTQTVLAPGQGGGGNRLGHRSHPRYRGADQSAGLERDDRGGTGKGFAVVASEVKNLASQTARATQDIGERITAIQATTQETSGKIGSVSQVIGHISEASCAIASAVEEQGAATQEIARNAQEAANGTGQVSQTIVRVNDNAGETERGATSIQALADGLSDRFRALKSRVDDFLEQVRAA